MWTIFIRKNKYCCLFCFETEEKKRRKRKRTRKNTSIMNFIFQTISLKIDFFLKKKKKKRKKKRRVEVETQKRARKQGFFWLIDFLRRKKREKKKSFQKRKVELFFFFFTPTCIVDRKMGLIFLIVFCLLWFSLFFFLKINDVIFSFHKKGARFSSWKSRNKKMAKKVDPKQRKTFFFLFQLEKFFWNDFWFLIVDIFFQKKKKTYSSKNCFPLSIANFPFVKLFQRTNDKISHHVTIKERWD